MSSLVSPYWPEKYRGEREACGPELGTELLEISDDIDDPVIKLKFLRGAIDRQTQYERRIQRLPCPPIRRALYRLHGLRALAPALAHADPESQEIVYHRMVAARWQVRRLAGSLVCGSLVAMPLLLLGWSFLGRSGPVVPPAAVASVAAQTPAPAVSREAAPTAPSTLKIAAAEPPATQEITYPAPPPAAEPLLAESLGQAPASIFVADRGSDWEMYSNGLRVETKFLVDGPARRYRVADRKQGWKPAVYSQPVGILFHTSESDLWPLEAGYGSRLRQSSAELINYVQRSKAYNYLIDRFGRVYRIVADETRASHAGHSVWAQGDDVYLDLNAAFIGISFESRWQAPEGESQEGRALPITNAQLVAGRNLTNYLRQRYGIAPEMCVTHGLTSIAPRQFLIGYHRDWATGFPFAAFGLPDQYAQPPAAVTVFGFGHDDDFRRAVGKLSPGLITAERMLTKEAQDRGISLDALRQERRALYEKWRKQQRGKRSVASEAPMQQAAVK
jgi:hypothetical protein